MPPTVDVAAAAVVDAVAVVAAIAALLLLLLPLLLEVFRRLVELLNGAKSRANRGRMSCMGRCTASDGRPARGSTGAESSKFSSHSGVPGRLVLLLLLLLPPPAGSAPPPRPPLLLLDVSTSGSMGMMRGRLEVDAAAAAEACRGS